MEGQCPQEEGWLEQRLGGGEAHGAHVTAALALGHMEQQRAKGLGHWLELEPAGPGPG